MIRSLFALVSLAVLTVVPGAAAPGELPSDYVFPTTPFDVAQADAQMSPGNSTIRGTIAAKEGRALVPALNLSRTHRADKGTIVTLMPYTAHLAEWLATDKRLSRKATLKKAMMTPEALSYRIVTKVTDDAGTFEFTHLRPGKYFIIATVNYVVAGSRLQQTGSVDTYVGGNLVASNPTYTSHAFAVDVSKAATAVVQIDADGQTVSATVRGQ